MKRIADIFNALTSLFFDDGRLALGIVILLACTDIVARHASPWAPMTLLVGGTLALLFESVVRGAAPPGPLPEDCNCNASPDA